MLKNELERKQFEMFLLCNKVRKLDKKMPLPKVICKEIYDYMNPYMYVLTYPLNIGTTSSLPLNQLAFQMVKDRPVHRYSDISIDRLESSIPLTKNEIKNRIFNFQDEAINACIKQQTTGVTNNICKTSPFILKIKRPKYINQIELSKKFLLDYEEILVPSNCEKSIEKKLSNKSKEVINKSKTVVLFDVTVNNCENKLNTKNPLHK